MNKKIIFFAFTLFIGSVGQIHTMRDGGDNYSDRNDRNDNSSSSSSGYSEKACVGGFGIGKIIETMQEVKLMDRTDQRNYYSKLSQISSRGPCTPGYAYWPKNSEDYLKDALRNQPEFGGPANAAELAYEDYTKTSCQSLYRCHSSKYHDYMCYFQQFRDQALNAGGGSLEEKIMAYGLSVKDPVALRIKAQQEIDARIRAVEYQVAAAQASKAVAVQSKGRTEEEEFAIAMKVIEKSKELQDYAAALLAARK